MSLPLTSALNFAVTSSLTYTNADPRAFIGLVETTVQALRLTYAARQGIVPRIIRRLNRKERKEWVVSGAVFVFDVKESGIQRWTDGRVWTPSRIVGNFLMYREMNERTVKGHIDECASGERKSTPPGTQMQRRRHRSAASSANLDEYIKTAGLMKKTITIRIHNLDYHLIAYYTQEDLDLGCLNGISSRSDIMSLDLPPRIFHFSDFRHPPRVEMAEDGHLEIICDPEPMESTGSAAESARNDISVYRLETMDAPSDDISVWDWPPHSPAAALPQNPGMTISSGQVHIDSWQQEQFDSTEETLQGSSQPIHRSSPVPLDIHHRNNRERLQQVWSSPSSPSHPDYNPVPSNSNTELHISRMGINDTTETDERLSPSRSGNGGTRHIDQSQPIWLPAANQNTALPRQDSGVMYIHSMPSSPHYPSAAHHAYGFSASGRDEGASSAPSGSSSRYQLNSAAAAAAAFERASQSTSQYPYAPISSSQSYDIERDDNVYEYYRSMQG